MKKIEGLIVAPFTPFKEGGEVNFEPIAAYAKLLVKSGLKGVFVNGSSGEGYMLTTEERKQLLEKWMEVLPSDMLVFAHVGSCCLEDSKEIAKHAAKLGVDAISTMAPPFPKIARIEELVAYCDEIASAAPDVPFYYYHIPVFSGAFFNMIDLIKAVEDRIPNFVGIKYTHETLYDFNQCALYKGGKYEMLHGQDETLLSALVMGRTIGGICGTGNYIGLELNSIINNYNEGNIDKAREAQDFSQAVINVIAKYRGNIVAGKRIMKLIGLDLGKNRVPFRNLSDEEETLIQKELETIGFFERCNKL